jgi:replicative DNA helicase
VLEELRRLRACVSPLTGISWHLEQVISASFRRRAIKSAEEISAASRNGQSDQEIVQGIDKMRADAISRIGRRDFVRAGPDLTAAVRMAHFAGRSGIVDLRMGDRFDGIRPGEVFVILARSWVGKSAWAAQAVVNSKAQALIISLEMPAEQWWERILGQVWGIRPAEVAAHIARGELSPDQTKALESIEQKVTVADRCEGSIPSILAALSRAESIGRKPALLVIDHLSLMRSSGRSDYERASDSAVEVKRTLARQCKLPVVLICQVKRGENSDGSTEVGLHDARDSGKIEENADQVLGLWRPSQKKSLRQDEIEMLRTQMRGRMLKERRGHGFAWNFRIDPWTIQVTPEV